MIRIHRLLVGLGFALIAGPAGAAETPGQLDFSRDVLPILSDKCFHCHGPDETGREGDLRLDQRDQVLADRGGYRVLVPGNLEQSALWQRLIATDADERMPPADQPRQVSAEERAILRSWIEQGAAWSSHWAFEPPRRLALPRVVRADWPRNGIDRFVLKRLESQGLQPAAEADKETLIRRVTLELTGLPPTSDEVIAFLQDAAPGAYERLVDRLLASPRYGEHMAMFWLDVARYADTDGYQNDRLRYMWVWRDWVIQALNQNLPFDQFTLEQLAGDMLPQATLRQQIATGFGRNHRINSEGGSIPDEWAAEYVVDRVDTLGTVWLGLTIGCARCHEHKYDPVTHQDYYRLFAFFNNVPEWGLGPNNGNSPPFITVPKSWPLLTAEQDRAIEPAPYKLKTTQTSVVRPLPGGADTVMVMHESPTPRPTYRLQRGLYNQPDKSTVLQPAVPPSLGRLDTDQPANRLGLAHWLTDDSNPLTARVTVNRYWQQFFGTGLVKTSENFGIQGEHPSHPQLLDWLATEFVRRQWDVKEIHRLIVSSATYRQSSRVSPRLLAKDPENRLLARGPRFRLPAHVVRDQALAVSGLLVEQTGGAPVKPYMPPGIWRSISNNKYVQDHGSKLYRRSLYTYWRRTVPPPTMMTFNAAEREVCIVRKERTNSAAQALTLLNNVVFLEASRLLAERMLREAEPSLDAQVSHGFHLVLGRLPTSDESTLMREAYETFEPRFRSNGTSATELLGVGEYPRDTRLDPAQHAAMTLVASTILNLDETVTKE